MAKKAEFTLKVTENRYKGETYTQLVGSIKDGNQSILVSIPCDSSGNVPFYDSKSGDRFCYARAVKFTAGQRSRKRRNEF